MGFQKFLGQKSAKIMNRLKNLELKGNCLKPNGTPKGPFL
jgi:hypothetical protein